MLIMCLDTRAVCFYSFRGHRCECSQNLLKARTHVTIRARVWTRYGPFGTRKLHFRFPLRMHTIFTAPSYETARKIKVEQDVYCSKARAGEWGAIKGQHFPENLQWESLVEILRGRVKVYHALA